MMMALGQLPFYPPNVKGWPGGESWITTYTLLLRQAHLRLMVEATTVAPMDDAMKRPIEGRSLRNAGNAAKPGPTMAGVDSAALMRALLPRQPIDPIAPDAPSGTIVAAAMLDPIYQLK